MGEACPYLHVSSGDQTASGEQANEASSTSKSKKFIEKASAENEKKVASDATPTSTPPQPPRREIQVSTTRIVTRPTSTAEAQDPRAFQIKQIATRFSAKEEIAADGGALLTFKMAPSDPDFPFEIEALECCLRVPQGFPRQQAPTLKVTNREMERGYQINVERGFDAMWSEMGNATLLGAMKLLDKQLETLLTARKADTIKLVINAGPAPSKLEATKPTQAAQKANPPQHTHVAAAPPSPPKPRISVQRSEQAKAKRKAETEMLEHRLNRHTQFTREANGTIYTVPIDPRKRNALPVLLQAVKAIRLFVPEAYDLEACSIELLGVDGDAAAAVEKAFARRVAGNSDATILAHINYLAQNMHSMAAETAPAPAPPVVQPAIKPEEVFTPETPKDQGSKTNTDLPDGQSHIKFIPRPPEWSLKPITEHEETSDSEYDYTTSEDDGTDNEVDGAKEPEPSTTSHASSNQREKGILISFPHMELYSIELLELTSPNITIKCERCKDTMDISRIKNNEKGDYTGIRSESCKKCAFSFGIGMFAKVPIVFPCSRSHVSQVTERISCI